MALHILKMALKCLICFSSLLSRSLSQFYSCRSCQRMSLYLVLLGVWLLSLRLSWRTESHVNHRLQSSSPRVRQATVSHADSITLPRQFNPSNQLLSWGEWNPNHFFSREHASVTLTIHFFLFLVIWNWPSWFYLTAQAHAAMNSFFEYVCMHVVNVRWHGFADI